MSADNKAFFERALKTLSSQPNFDLLRCKPESTNSALDAAVCRPDHPSFNVQAFNGQSSLNIRGPEPVVPGYSMDTDTGMLTSLEDFQARSRLNREPRQLIGLLGDSTLGRTFAEVSATTITSADAIIANLEEIQQKLSSPLEDKLRAFLYESYLGNSSVGYPVYPVVKKEKLHVHQGVLEFSVEFNYDALVPARKAAPAVKRAPQLKVGDEVTWEFHVEGVKERTASITIKSLSEHSFLLRDNFVVDGLDIRQQNPYTKVGKVVIVRRVDVVNGGHKIIYSNV